MHAELDDVVRHQCASWWTDRGAVRYRAAGIYARVPSVRKRSRLVPRYIPTIPKSNKSISKYALGRTSTFLSKDRVVVPLPLFH